MNNRIQYEKYCLKKLKEAKKYIMALVVDQDGTVKGGDDPRYAKADIAKLLQKIATAGKYPAIITASGASALKSFAVLTDFYSKKKILAPTYIGIGNGTALYRFDENGRTEIYNHCLSFNEVKKIVNIWQKTYQKLGIKESSLQPKGINIIKDFGRADWTGYIPSSYLTFFKQFNGRCFTEHIKVTVVFPSWEAEKQRDLVAKMQAALDKDLEEGKYFASRGDETFLHITRGLGKDPKLFALEKIMEILNLKPTQIVAFGDMPEDNDRGLLVESEFPYAFSNQAYQSDPEKPPYLLPGSIQSPVGSVYRAIDFLLS